MMLNYLEIEGYKSIKDIRLEFGALNVMIGANGAGKSNIISLFHLIDRIVESGLQLYVGQCGGADTILHFGQKVTDRISVKADFGGSGYEFVLVPTRDDRLIFSREGYFYREPGKNEPFIVSLGSGHKESILIDEAQKNPGKPAARVLDMIKNRRIYHFHDTSDTARMKQPCNINDNFFLKPDASNLAAYLFLLEKTYQPNYKKIVETIRLAAPFFNGFNLRPSPFNDQLIQLEWREKGTHTYFNAHSLSDGTLRFICLATLLLQPHLPSTILLDEPELGLHPYAIALLAALLKKAARKTQVIVATQSVTLVNQLSPEDIMVVEREETHSIFRHLKEEDTANTSKRLLEIFPDYEKVSDGPVIVGKIGLEKIREECAHFNQWMTQLEKL
jgi:predicted ATPase